MDTDRDSTPYGLNPYSIKITSRIESNEGNPVLIIVLALSAKCKIFQLRLADPLKVDFPVSTSKCGSVSSMQIKCSISLYPACLLQRGLCA